MITDRDQFEYWLASLDEMLQEFFSTIHEEYRKQLDLSPASLDTLEGIILQRYADAKAMLDPNESSFVNGLACYIGETFRKAIGGRWTIRLDDAKFAFYGLPIIADAGKDRKTVECPLTLATAAADRRTGKYLRTVLAACRS